MLFIIIISLFLIQYVIIKVVSGREGGREGEKINIYKINECTLLLLIVRDKTSGCGVGSN